MRRRPLPAADRHPDVLTLAAATWLACGIVLLGLTPLPLHDATLGWSPAFWLLAAPSLLLLARRARVLRPVAAAASCRTAAHARPTRTPAARRRPRPGATRGGPFERGVGRSRTLDDRRDCVRARRPVRR
ncbi:MAG: hypothetical protein ACREPJ_14620 [Rhodanobacteraceae bacterium]